MTDRERGETIQRMKGMTTGGHGAVFPIRRDDLSVIGYLRTIDRSILEDCELIETMALNRTKHRKNFLTQFDVTPENKKNWLENGVLNNPNKVLFLVEAADGTVVGQDGFTMLGGGVFSLDGTMRWMKVGEKDLYVRSGVARAGICFSFLDCGISTTEVFEDNIANVKNSIRMGHEIVEVSPLFLSEKNEVFRYDRIPDVSRSNTDRRLICFEMKRAVFVVLHGAIYKKNNAERERFDFNHGSGK